MKCYETWWNKSVKMKWFATALVTLLTDCEWRFDFVRATKSISREWANPNERPAWQQCCQLGCAAPPDLSGRVLSRSSPVLQSTAREASLTQSLSPKRNLVYPPYDKHLMFLALHVVTGDLTVKSPVLPNNNDPSSTLLKFYRLQFLPLVFYASSQNGAKHRVTQTCSR